MPSSANLGNVTVADQDVQITVTYLPAAYGVQFKEVGLPSRTVGIFNETYANWSVTLTNRTSQQSETVTWKISEILLAVPNGSSSYGVEPVSGYVSRPTSGTLTVAGASVSRTIRFAGATSSVKFTESGLPSGTSWWVNLTNGQRFETTTGTASFKEANGTYHYDIATADKGYRAGGGAFTVTGPS